MDVRGIRSTFQQPQPPIKQLKMKGMTYENYCVLDGMNIETNLYLIEELADFSAEDTIFCWPSPIMKLHEASKFCESLAYAHFYQVVGPKTFNNRAAQSLLRIYERQLRRIQWTHVALVMARETSFNLAFQDHQRELEKKYEAALAKDRNDDVRWENFLNDEEAQKDGAEFVAQMETSHKAMALASEQNEK